MVEDRTIVVESVATGGSAPLDEGSLLVIRVPNEGDEEVKSRLMPLGKVFEVFGPVSRPLYTIRLPSAKDKPAKSQDVNGSVVERDADEISLNDDESEEHADGKEGETTVKVSSDDLTSANNADTKGQNGTNENDSTGFDPWAPDGKYTKLLKSSTTGTPVYYIPDITKLLDTGAVIRNSGRGCGELPCSWTAFALYNANVRLIFKPHSVDASNLYDEEVINVNDMEFSDDEQEREFKNRNKRGKKGRRKNDGHSSAAGRGRGSGGASYTGFHAPPPPQYAIPVPNQPMQYQAAPGGYPYQQQYAYSQAPKQYAQGAPGYATYPAYSQGIPPPPPPQYPYPPYPHTESHGAQHPNQSTQGQHGDETSDTVYYD